MECRKQGFAKVKVIRLLDTPISLPIHPPNVITAALEHDLFGFELSFGKQSRLLTREQYIKSQINCESSSCCAHSKKEMESQANSGIEDELSDSTVNALPISPQPTSKKPRGRKVASKLVLEDEDGGAEDGSSKKKVSKVDSKAPLKPPNAPKVSKKSVAKTGDSDSESDEVLEVSPPPQGPKAPGKTYHLSHNHTSAHMHTVSHTHAYNSLFSVFTLAAKYMGDLLLSSFDLRG